MYLYLGDTDPMGVVSPPSHPYQYYIGMGGMVEMGWWRNHQRQTLWVWLDAHTSIILVWAGRWRNHAHRVCVTQVKVHLQSILVWAGWWRSHFYRV